MTQKVHLVLEYYHDDCRVVKALSNREHANKIANLYNNRAKAHEELASVLDYNRFPEIDPAVSERSYHVITKKLDR